MTPLGLYPAGTKLSKARPAATGTQSTQAARAVCVVFWSPASKEPCTQGRTNNRCGQQSPSSHSKPTCACCREEPEVLGQEPKDLLRRSPLLPSSNTPLRFSPPSLQWASIPPNQHSLAPKGRSGDDRHRTAHPHRSKHPLLRLARQAPWSLSQPPGTRQAHFICFFLHFIRGREGSCRSPISPSLRNAAGSPVSR